MGAHGQLCTQISAAEGGPRPGGGVGWGAKRFLFLFSFLLFFFLLFLERLLSSVTGSSSSVHQENNFGKHSFVTKYFESSFRGNLKGPYLKIHKEKR